MRKILAIALVGLLAASANAALVESEPNNSIGTADLFPVGTYVPDGGASYAGALTSGDGIGGVGDIDFYSITLAAGDLIGAAVYDHDPNGAGDQTGSTTTAGDPSMDSFIGLYNPAGTLVATDDDDGPGFLSSLYFRIPVGGDGLWTIAVSGFGDFSGGVLDGVGHDDFDAYLLDISTNSAVPEPATMGLLLAGAGLLARRRR